MDRIGRMKYEELTSVILECCFEVSNELGAGFLESVYERLQWWRSLNEVCKYGLKYR